MALEKRYRILWKDASSSNTVDITHAIDLGVDEAIESSTDSVVFTFNNIVLSSLDTSNKNLQGKNLTELIDIGDKIEIYFGEGSGVPSNLEITGFVDEIKIDSSRDNLNMTVKSANKLEKLLKALVNITEENSYASDVVVEVISKINDLNRYQKIAGGLWNSQLSESSLSESSQTWNSGSGLTNSINSGFKGGTNGNITITCYTDPAKTNADFLGGNSYITFTLSGTDSNGNSLSDTIRISSTDEGNTKACSSNFETIISISHDVLTNSISDNKIVVGTGGVRNTTKTINFYSHGKEGYRIIEDISENKNTGDGSYLGFLTNQDVFIWKGKESNSTNTISLGENDNWGTVYTDYIPAMDFIVKRGSWDLINRIRLIMGDDFSGNRIYVTNYDVKSVLTVGWKEKMYVYESYTNKLKAEHPEPESYPTTWGPDGVGVANIDQVNAELKRLVKIFGEEISSAFLDKRGISTYKVNATFEYTEDISNSLYLGALVNIINDKYKWYFGNEKKMRVHSRSLIMGPKNIILKIMLMEDVETAISDYDIIRYDKND